MGTHRSSADGSALAPRSASAAPSPGVGPSTAEPPWDIAGPADRPAIVFVHGTRVTRTSWQPVIHELREDFRCLALDLPAHGSMAGEPFTLEGAIEAVERAVTVVGGRATLVGLSLGGYVAIAFAERYPEQVRGLVIAGATTEPAGRAALAFRSYAWALGAVPARTLDAVNSWFFRRRFPPEVAEPIIAAGYWTAGGATAVQAITRMTFRDRLLAYGGPILAINGDLDVLFRLGERAFLRGIPNVTRRTMRWTTHLSPLDRPALFAAHVRSFVERVWR